MARIKKTKQTRRIATDISLASSDYMPPAFADLETTLASTSYLNETKDSPAQKFPNLNNTPIPFKNDSGNAYLDANEAITLSLKAYWSFPLYRNTVEVMGEFANSPILLKGGNAKTREFLKAWFKRINLWHLKEQFFRDWFRAANVFIYRFDGVLNEGQVKKLTQVYGEVNTQLPIKYLLLNPEHVRVKSSLDFSNPNYVKQLSPYELERIRNPQTQEDRDFVASLDKAELSKLKNGYSLSKPSLTLDSERLCVLKYKCQSYEPMGVPMVYPVLEDIEAKKEMKRIDLSIARTTDRALLLLTVGETPNEYTKGANINPNTIQALQTLFANEGVARTLVADYTVKGEWLIPDINKILGEEKYKQIDKDISVGLNAVIFDGNDKFANTSIKVKIFIERLKEAQNAFLNNFLQEEIVRVCKAINAKNYPTAEFQELSLDDPLQYWKLYVQMAQVGLLTAEETFEAMESGVLPLKEDSEESQKEFKKLKEEGLYAPLLGGSTELQKEQLKVTEKLGLMKQVASPAPGTKGRPEGSKSPKSSTTRKPISKTKASLSSLKEIVPLVSLLHDKVEKAIKKKFNEKTLSESSKILSQKIAESIIANIPIYEWKNLSKESLLKPAKENKESITKIENLQVEHDLDFYSAALLNLASVE